MITPTEAQHTYTLGEPMLVADAVLDLAGRHPEQFDMGEWQYQLEGLSDIDGNQNDSCGTAACIAGWVGILHNDQQEDIMRLRAILYNMDTNNMMDKWEMRQARRLGLDHIAGNLLFHIDNNDVALNVLTSVSKWHTHNTGLIDENEMVSMMADNSKQTEAEVRAMAEHRSMMVLSDVG